MLAGDDISVAVILQVNLDVIYVKGWGDSRDFPAFLNQGPLDLGKTEIPGMKLSLVAKTYITGSKHWWPIPAPSGSYQIYDQTKLLVVKGQMDDLRFYVIFNSISVLSG